MPDNSLTPVNVDLSDVKSFEAAPPDVYEWVVVDVKDQRPGKKDPSGIMWTIVCQILSNVSGETTQAKKKAWHTLYYSKDAQGFMADFLAGIGFPFDQTPGVENTIDPMSWMNQTFRAEGAPSDDKKFTNIGKIFPKNP